MKDRYGYIPSPQSSRDYIFNKKAYDILNFWEKIRQNIYLCQSTKMVEDLKLFFNQINQIRNHSERKVRVEDWFMGFKGDFSTEIKNRYYTISEEITNSEMSLKHPVNCTDVSHNPGRVSFLRVAAQKRSDDFPSLRIS